MSTPQEDLIGPDWAAFQQDLAKSVESEDRQAAWRIYLSAWESGTPLEMSTDLFEWIFSYGGAARTREACTLVNGSRLAARLLREACSGLTWTRLQNDSDVRMAWAAAMGADHVIETWRASRKATPFGMRGHLARAMVSTLAELQGREWLRRELPGFIQFPSEWNEEEQESLIQALARSSVLTGPLLASFGPEGVAIYDRLVARGRIEPYELNPPSSLPLAGVAAREPALALRLGDLLREVQFPTDLRDAGLSSEEHAAAHHSSQRWRQYMRHRLRHWGPKEEGLLFYLATLDHSTDSTSDRLTKLGFPLIQILHIRSILDAPIFREAVANPSDHWQPEVFFHLLGREGVSYWPELRLAANTDRRWRARWVEQAGEALAILFFEQALGLDLSTLNRIPETNKESTPDFKAACETGPLVFETKGSSNWGKHGRQRKEALAQLRKHEDSVGIGWAAQGRCFAASLFAASQGDPRASLLYVQDPPFAFDYLFSEGWQVQARRRHYAGVLEACGLFEAADRFLDEGEIESLEGAYFRLPSRDSREGLVFVGTYSSPAEVARQIGHPRPEAYRGLKVFRGVDQRRLRSQLSFPSKTIDSDSLISVAGALPEDEESPNSSKSGGAGVYSLLSDGALLVIQWDPV